jgi:hypothetical protein
VESRTRQTALAQQIFGGATQQLLPLLREGSAGFQRYGAQLRGAGGVMSKDQVQAAQELGTQLNLLKDQASKFAVVVGAALVPAAQMLVTSLREILGPVVTWIGENPGFVTAIFTATAAVFGLGLALHVLGHVLSIASFAFTALKILLAVLAVGIMLPLKIVTFATAVAMGVLSAALLVGKLAWAAYGVVAAVVETVLSAGVIPAIGAAVLAVLAMPLAIAGVVAALAYLSGNLDVFSGVFDGIFTGLGETFKEVWEGIANAIKAGDLGLALKIALAGVKVVWFTAIANLQYAWGTFIDGLLNFWDRFTTRLAIGMVRTWADLQRLWENGTFNVKQMWADALNWILDRIRTWVGNLVYAGVRAARALNPTTTAAEDHAAAEHARQAIASRIQGVSGPNAQAHVEALQRINQHESDMVDELNHDQARTEAARQRQRTLDWIKAMQRGNADRAGLSNLAGEAAQGASWADYMRAKMQRRMDAMNRQVDTFAGNLRGSSVGTFSGAAAAALAGGEGPAERTARNTQAMVGLLREIRDQPSGIPLV